MVTHPASSLAQDRESSPAETSVLTMLRRQLIRVRCLVVVVKKTGITASFAVDVTQEHFKCAYDYTCKMDLSNRRFCKRCRLGKCFQIGMRREYILSDDERAMKRQKIIENRSNAPLL